MAANSAGGMSADMGSHIGSGRGKKKRAKKKAAKATQTSSPAVASPMKEEDYRAQSDADALMRAEEVRADKGRHSKAQHHLRKRAQQAMRAMTGGGRKKADGRSARDKRVAGYEL